MAETPGNKSEACEPAGKRARLIAAQRLRDLEPWSQAALHADDSSALHRLRIAVKRLRYTLEIFADVLPETCRSFLPQLERLQDELGALHDSDLLIALLQRWRQEGQQQAAAPAEGSGQQEGRAEEGVSGSGIEVNPKLLAALGPAPGGLLAGLDALLQRLQQEREQRFEIFRLYWQTLEAERFRQRLLEELAV
jgi:hypothetical protein